MSRKLAIGFFLLAASLLYSPPVAKPGRTQRAQAQAPCTVEVHAVELTQSIQKSPLAGGGAGDAVTLVAGRRTTARVYVTSTCVDDDVVAWLNIASSPSGGSGSIDAEGVHQPIKPPTLVGDLNSVRAADDNRAFAFWWRSNSLDQSDQSYDIKVYACSLSDTLCNTMYTGSPRARVPASIWSQTSPDVFALPTQTFVYRKTPRILGFPVKQENPLAGEPGEPDFLEPDWARIQPVVADPMIRAMLPLPVTPLPYEVTTAIRLPEPIPPEGLSGLTRDLWPRDMLYPLICANDGDERLHSDYLVALTPPDVFGPGDGEGYGGGQAANNVAAVDVAPNPQFRTILAHEVQHAMGFDHDDSTGTTGEIGWDVWRAPMYGGGRVRLGGLTDLIEIADFGSGDDGARWMSVKNTNDIIAEATIYDRTGCLRSFGGLLESPDPRPDPLDSLLVLAHVNDIAPFTPAITSVTAHHGREDVTPLTPGDYAIRLVDAAGTPLYTSGMVLDNTGTSTGYSISVPDLPLTQSVELLHLGAVKDSITRTANAPSVTLLTPASSTVVTDTTTVSWTADDADGDTLAYDLYWRHTGSGDAWEAIAIGALTTTLTVEMKDLPAGTQGAFKVVARDGLNQATALAQDLTLANHAPRAEIVSPSTGDVYIQGEFIDFQSSVRDVDEPNWVPPSITGTSSLDGVISTDGDPPLGGGLPLPPTVSPAALSVGTHILTVEACDSAGLCATDSVTITVAP